MTLKELLSQLHLDVNFPNELGSLTVKNAHSIRTHVLLNYFQSRNVQDDLKTCLNDYNSAKNNNKTCCLIFKSRPSLNSSLYMSVAVLN